MSVQYGHFLTVLDYENAQTYVYRFTKDMYDHYNQINGWEDLIFEKLGFREKDIHWMCNTSTKIESITEPITWSVND
tara:strand:- start:1257 stop:1487 length:231 start_codon:yes stop_codon:yes gene_type:complete